MKSPATARFLRKTRSALQICSSLSIRASPTSSIDQQDLAATVGPAIVVNVAPVTPRQLLSVDDLAAAQNRVQPGTRLLLRTNWHKRYGTPGYRDKLPRISLELAQWLTQRRIALLGVEPPSVAGRRQPGISPAAFDIATGECLAEGFPQGHPTQQH